jgi:hypothetical protein
MLRYIHVVVAILIATYAANVRDAVSQEQQRYVAADIHNDGVGPFVWGTSKDDTRARAVESCKRVSKTCSGTAAYTNTMTDVFVYACCTAPSLRCTATFDVTAKDAELVVLKILSDAGLSRCAVRRTLSAATGK